MFTSNELATLQEWLYQNRERITKDWLREISNSTDSPTSYQDFLNTFIEMTDKVIFLLISDQPNFHIAYQVGKSLADLHFVTPEVFGKSQVYLGEILLKDLTSQQKLFIYPRLIRIFAEMTNGFIHSDQETAIYEQEQIPKALTEDIRVADKPPPEISTELQQGVDARTNSLEELNIDLLREVEQHQLTQIALLDSEEKWHSLVKNAPERIMLIEPDGTISFINHTYPNRTPEEVIGTKVFEHIAPQYHDMVRSALKSVFEKAQPAKYSLIYHNTPEDEAFFENSITPIIHDGIAKQAILIATDVTPREIVIQALRESEANFSALAENAYDGIVITTLEGDYLYANQRFHEIIGFSIADLDNKSLISLVAPRERHKFIELIQKTSNGEEIKEQRESLIVNKTKHEVPIEITLTITTWKGNPSYLAIVRDITDRKQAELSLQEHTAEIAKLHEQLRLRRIEEQAALLDFSQSMISVTDEEQVLNKTIKVICDIFKPDYCDIHLIDETHQTIYLAAGYGWKTSIVKIPLESNSTANQILYTLKQNKPVIVADMCSENRFSPPEYLVNHEIQSNLTVPMVGQTYTIGVMGIHWKDKGKASSAYARLLPVIVNMTSTTLERVRLFEQEKTKGEILERTNELITALNQTATQLVSTLEPDQIIETLDRELKKIHLNCGIVQFDQEKQHFSKVHSSLDPKLIQDANHILGINLKDLEQVQPILQYLYARYVEKRIKILSADEILDEIIQIYPLAQQTVQQALKILGIRYGVTTIWLPLIAGQDIIGILVLWGDDLAASDLPATEVFASQVAATLENAYLFRQLNSSRENLRALSNKLVEVQENERRQIARELHDEIGQSLTGLSLLLNTQEKTDSYSFEHYNAAMKLVEDLIGRTQELSLDLRPAMLDEMGLLPTLLWFFQRYTQQTGIQVNFVHSGLNMKLPPAIETTAYRLVQEALTNVTNYAGVLNADVRVWTDSQNLSIQVEDQGVGFDYDKLSENSKLQGLANMQERVNLLGGRFNLISSPGAGTTMFATLPR